MDMRAGFQLLEKYGIPVAKYKLVKEKEKALEFAAHNGYPIALKVDSPDILHKTDKGVVAFGIKNGSELIEAWNRIIKNAGKARVNGVIVQEHVAGREVIIGGKHDPQFGELVLFGLGGIFVEIFKDVSMRITPFSRREALDMIKEIKGYPLLAGARGEKPVNIRAIVDTIMKVQKLMVENPIKELDINPLFVDEHGIKAVDVRVIK